MTRPHFAEASALMRMATTPGVTDAQRVALTWAAGREMDRDAAEQAKKRSDAVRALPTEWVMDAAEQTQRGTG